MKNNSDQGVKALEFYRDKFAKHGVDPKSLSWKSLGASHQRFRVLWKQVDFNHKSVLDVGCGFGEMARWLRKRYICVNYTGVDIVPEFVQIAKDSHPYYKFETRDFFANPIDKKFDIVMAVGVMNSNLGEDNMDFRKKAIRTLFDHSKEVATFSMLGAHPQPKNKESSNVWYADSHEVFDYCKDLVKGSLQGPSPQGRREVVLKEDYHPRDFTVFMYK